MVRQDRGRPASSLAPVRISASFLKTPATKERASPRSACAGPKSRTVLMTTREGSSGSTLAVGSRATSGCRSRSFDGWIVIPHRAKTPVTTRARPGPVSGPLRTAAASAPTSVASQGPIRRGAGFARTHRAADTTTASPMTVTARSGQPADRKTVAPGSARAGSSSGHGRRAGGRRRASVRRRHSAGGHTGEVSGKTTLFRATYSSQCPRSWSRISGRSAARSIVSPGSAARS